MAAQLRRAQEARQEAQQLAQQL
eukprot:COSAG01_NODE_50116_length_366_cov_0.764045_1_plen_22_part_01